MASQWTCLHQKKRPLSTWHFCMGIHAPLTITTLGDRKRKWHWGLCVTEIAKNKLRNREWKPRNKPSVCHWKLDWRRVYFYLPWILSGFLVEVHSWDKDYCLAWMSSCCFAFLLSTMRTSSVSVMMKWLGRRAHFQLINVMHTRSMCIQCKLTHS